MLNRKERKLSNFRLSKVKLFVEDSARRLNKTVPEMD